MFESPGNIGIGKSRGQLVAQRGYGTLSLLAVSLAARGAGRGSSRSPAMTTDRCPIRRDGSRNAPIGNTNDSKHGRWLLGVMVLDEYESLTGNAVSASQAKDDD